MSEAPAYDDDDFAEVFTAAGFAGDGSPVLLAVSGGPDSIALMGAAAAWCRSSEGPALAVATVDHGLRSEAHAEAASVAGAARRLGLSHAILTWTDPPSGPVSQQAAREARYRLLAAHAQGLGIKRLATAHTFDDQVETVLMRLADGSGLTGLAGMTASRRRGDLVHLRPFLHLKKAGLVATCRARGWPFVEDPSNADPRFARSRWRALLPVLAAEGLGPDRVFRFAGRMRRADLALDAMADAVEGRLLTSGRQVGTVVLDLAALVQEPDEIALRVFIRALRRADAGGKGTSDHLRLERAEAALAALRAARMMGEKMRRTLAGRLLALGRSGILTIAPEAPRQRGR